MKNEARFWQRVAVVPSGCWLWLGHVTPRGYAMSGGVYMHRWRYERDVGPIPEGLTIDHLCRVKRCVNPAHMEPVTREENYRRWLLTVVACANGHRYTEASTYWYRGYRQCRTCHAEQQRERRSVLRLAG